MKTISVPFALPRNFELKVLKFTLLLTGLFLSVSCDRQSSDKILVENDFDGLRGWGLEHASINSERAHSGKYSVKIDGGLEFGLTFNQILGTLTNKKPKQINVELWAYIPANTAKASFVVTLSKPESQEHQFYQSFNLVDKTKNYREWVKISKRLELPDDIQLSDKFGCYLWRSEPSEEVVYIDDLKITVLE